jgi:hypothetical protein
MLLNRPGRLWAGVARRGVASEPPPAKGEFASRPMVARLVRYPTVRCGDKLFLGGIFRVDS